LAALVPALGYFLLFFIYLCAMIGNFNWGSVPTYDVAFKFLGDIGHLSHDLGISVWIPLSAMFFPFAGLVAFFQWKAQGFRDGIETLDGGFRSLGPPRQKALLFACAGVWSILAAGIFFLNADPNIFGHFKYDPVVGFFQKARPLFAVNDERLRWAGKDKLAAESLHHPPPRVKNVILFVVDALRADHLACYGYSRPVSPYISELSGLPSSRKIEWALSNGSESVAGQMAMISSKEPRDISDMDYTLPDFFHDNGFKSIIFYSGDSQWCNFNHSFGEKIDLFADGVSHPGPGGINDDRMLLDLVDGLKPDDGKPHFICLHLLSTHEGGFLQDSYLLYRPFLNFVTLPFLRPGQGEWAEKTQEAVNMYDDRILQADTIIGQIMGKLREKGYLNNYVAVITADHGQALGEGDWFGHTRFVSAPILHIPLLFFGSKPLPRFPDTRFATTLDIAPTLADLAGLEAPYSWQGQSLLRKRTNYWTYHLTPSPREGNEGAVVFYDKGEILKYSCPLEEDGDFPGSEAVFDLAKDPKEKNNLINTIARALLGQMRHRAREHFSVY
jgi:arylsulfatase